MSDERRGLFVPGDFLERYYAKRNGWLSAKIWNGAMGELASAINSLRVTTFNGGLTEHGLGGQLLSAFGGSSPPDVTPRFPFKVTVRPTPHAIGAVWDYTWQARVEYNSSISQPTEKLNDRQTISGLTVYNDDGTVADESWFNLNRGNDLIGVEVVLSPDVGGSTAQIKSYGNTSGGGNWSWTPSDPPQRYGSGSGKYEYQVQYDGAGNPYWIGYVTRIAIFESSTSGVVQPDGTYYVDSQLLNEHLQLEGYGLLGAWPGHG